MQTHSPEAEWRRPDEMEVEIVSQAGVWGTCSQEAPLLAMAQEGTLSQREPEAPSGSPQ